MTAYYYDTVYGKRVDCTNWFDKNALSFTVPDGVVNGPITVNLDVKKYMEAR